jgi:SdrD B-like domain
MKFNHSLATKLIVMCICTFTSFQSIYSQISGTVFKDFNFNGTQQPTGFPTEPGVYGVIVKAFDVNNVQVGLTATTGVNGNYTIAGVSGSVRVEFTPPTGTFNAKNAASGTNPNSTDVQFVTAPSATVYYAIASQDWYSNTANPYVATNGATNGDASSVIAGGAGLNNNLYIFPYNMGDGLGTADDGGATRRRPNSELGSVFGLAFQKTSRTLFMAAYLKRHIGFGPNGIGAIYKSSVDATGVPSAASLLVNVSAIVLTLVPTLER